MLAVLFKRSLHSFVSVCSKQFAVYGRLYFQQYHQVGQYAQQHYEQDKTKFGGQEDLESLTPQHQVVGDEDLENDWSFLSGANRKLYTAIDAYDVAGVKTALEEEADIQCEGDILWSTPLHLACERGDTNIVRVLLEQGAQWGATNSFGAAPIHLVAWSDKWNSVLVQLLENGADVNQRTISAELQQAAVPCLTPLHLAVSYEALSNVNTLLRYGADVNSQDNTGSTVLHYAVGKNLTQHPKNVSPLTQMLLNHKANVNLQNNVHKSPFWYSISSGHEALVSSFLQYNADLQQKDEKGRSVLHLAVLQGNWRIVDKLLKLGIESNVQDNEGNSPLQLAKSEGFVKIQNLLVQHKNLLQQQ